MTTLTKRLNTLFKSSHIITELNQEEQHLINTLLEAVNANHQFNTTQIYNFLKMTQYYPRNPEFLNSTNPDHQKIVEYIFTNYNIPDIYLEKLTYTLTSKNNKCQSLDYLFKRNYDFPIYYYAYLKHYHFFDIDCYTTNHTNVAFIAYQSIQQKKHTVFNKCIKLFEEGPFNFNALAILLNQIPNPNAKLLNAICTNATDDDLFRVTEINNKIKELNNQILEPQNYNIFTFILQRLTNKDKFIQYVIINEKEDDCFLTCIENGYIPTIDDIHIRLLKHSTMKYTRKYKFLSSSETFMLISKFDLKPNITTLNILCKRGYEKYVNFLITHHNIIPTNETLNQSMTSLNINIIRQILNHKILPDDGTINMLDKYVRKKEVADIVELLIIHGLDIKYEHIDKLISMGISLENLTRFNLKYDDRLYFSCFIHNYFIYEFPDIDPLKLKMYDMCRKKTKVYDIEDFLKTNNLKLNKYALHYLTCENPKIVSYLIQYYDIQPATITLLYSGILKNQTIINDIINKYNIQENMMEEYTINF